MRLKAKIVTVKVQRPIFSTGSMTEVLSYIVDENDEQISNPFMSEMPPEHIEQIFKGHHKVYYLAKHKNGKPVKLFAPTREDEWV